MTQSMSRCALRATVSLLLVSVCACGFSTGGSADPDPPNPADELDASTADARPHATIAPVALGTAGTYAILAKSGISGVIGYVTGDIGISPAAATYITGFSLSADASNTFSTSTQITGRVYAASYVAPTPTRMTIAVADMEIAFVDAAGRIPQVTELAGGLIGGLTLSPGSYAWSSGVAITQDVTLAGDATDVWILQVAQSLTMTAGTRVVLTGGALAKNVFWQISGGPLTLAAAADLHGIVLTQTAVTLAAGASVHGRVLSQTAVDVDGSTVVAPAP